LKPDDELEYNKCELEEGDDVFCDWELCGTHPLHCAAIDGNIKAIQSWLASGADINMVNKDGMTSLMSACLNLKEECVVELLRLGANVQMEDDDGETVLHKIAHYRSFDAMMCDIDLERIERMAKILIKAGCDPTTRNKNGKTFIDKLKRRDCNELAKIKHNKKMKI
jgi:ankyrin repeat protein